MATVNYYGPTYTGATGLAELSGSTLLATVNFPSSGSLDDYQGYFTYGSDGYINSGTVTSIKEYYHGNISFEVLGLNLPAVAVQDAVLLPSGTNLVDLLFGGADTILGSNYGDPIYGGPGNDSIIALDGNDTVAGASGDDDINGNVGEDIVVGGDGNDFVRGGKGNDTVSGDAGDDPHVNGNIGDDIVFGGTGADTCYGGQGADTVYGQDGNDMISGDLGNDILSGGAGADLFVLRAGGGVDGVTDFNAAEGDRVGLVAGTHYTYSEHDGFLWIDIGGGDQIALYGVTMATFSTSWVIGI